MYPKYWTQELKTAEEIIFYGKEFIRTMLKFKLEKSTCLEHHRDVLCERMGLIGMGRDYILTMAKKYENPLPIPSGNWHRDSEHAEPFDEASMQRKSGATTLNCCGWCKYAQEAGSGGRYGYYATAHCSFRVLSYGTDYARKFDQKCFLLNAPHSVLVLIADGLLEASKKPGAETKQTESEITFMQKLESLAERRPLLPEFRDWKFFQTGDRVVCFLDNVPDKNVEKDFAAGRVTHNTTYIDVLFDKKVRRSKDRRERKMTYHTGSPDILREWEFKYLVNYPKFAEIWIANCTEDKYVFFNSKRFKEALDKYREANQSN